MRIETEVTWARLALWTIGSLFGSWLAGTTLLYAIGTAFGVVSLLCMYYTKIYRTDLRTEARKLRNRPSRMPQPKPKLRYDKSKKTFKQKWTK